MKKYGCIGKKLGHSFSKDIHAKLADYKYELIELNEEEIDSFFKQKDFAAINVTIPYKQTVIPYLDSISEIANRIGAVNTIVNKDGKLLGYNTDYYGMKAVIEKTGIDFQNKKVLILGTGGTSKTAQIVAQDLGANQILAVSRRESLEFITYDQAKKNHSDANIIINTTPSGMFPDCESKPIDISYFPQLEGVIDAIYNPLCSNLILDAKEKIHLCPICQNLTDRELCPICADEERDRSVICVVTDARTVLAMEKVREYRGTYHVLHGLISPLNGITPEQLKIKELLARVGTGEVGEVIVATNPTVEGDTTALYLQRLLADCNLTITRLASGLPVGGDLEYADELTLGRSIVNRQIFKP